MENTLAVGERGKDAGSPGSFLVVVGMLKGRGGTGGGGGECRDDVVEERDFSFREG